MKKPMQMLKQLTVAAVLIAAGIGAHVQSAKIKLLSHRYAISLPAAAGEPAPPADIKKGFAVAMTVNLKPWTDDREILEIPGVLSVRLRNADPHDHGGQNYAAFKMADGSVPVLEAGLKLKQYTGDMGVREMAIGVPLAELERPWGEHKVVLNFTGIAWTLYVDGLLMDNDFPLGYPEGRKFTSLSRDDRVVAKASLFYPAASVKPIDDAQPRFADVQYFTPSWHNAWVGDVVSCYHKGRYHLFYLFDRRGHGSKFGHGGHYFEHLSTADFINWTEHTPATPLEYQWETVGTGTPFVWDGKLCLSYGMHTTRMFPREATALPEQWDWINRHGESKAIAFDTLKTIPAGASYAVSSNGVDDFKKSHILIHPAENPSIYLDDKGHLGMLANYGARGTWTSPRLNGGWKCVSEDFPPGGDCTFIFTWGKYDYIVGGFTHMWRKLHKDPIDKYEDMVARGLDFYDGLSVPAITRVKGGRYIMAGWMQLNDHWGGPLVIRELVQLPDGRIGSKWMEELVPATGQPRLSAAGAAGPITLNVDSSSFMLTFKVVPRGSGKVGVELLPRVGSSNGCEWQIDLASKRAQFAPVAENGFAPQQKTLGEGGQPSKAMDYAIANLAGVDEPFTVRMIVKHTGKFGGSVVDVEIAGRRTMLSWRRRLHAERLRFNPHGATIQAIHLAPLE